MYCSKSEKLEYAIEMAKVAHTGQLRKYTMEPYITHCFSVAGLVSSVSDDVDMITAAILHDTVEDSFVTIEYIDNLFGEKIADLVDDLTDISMKGDGNRAVRKAIDREHTNKASKDAKTIKIADVIDNTKNITYFDKDFAKVYLEEKLLLLDVLTAGDQTLWKHASWQINQGLLILNTLEN